MAWCIVKKEKCLEISFGQAFENIDGRVDLCEEIFSTKIAIVVFASFEKNPSFPKDKSQQNDGRKVMVDGLITITQVAPLGCQEVRDHD